MISSSFHADDSVTEKDVDIRQVRELSSAQQCVLLLNISLFKSPYNDTVMSRALQEGNGRLIVRIWKGSARWWNLNNNVDNNDGTALSPTCQLAKAEVSGYRIAHRALQVYNERQKKEKWPSTDVVIPKVLYFSHDNHNLINTEKADEAQMPWPWAIFSYVGESSKYFSTNDENTIHINGFIDKNPQPLQTNRNPYEMDDKNSNNSFQVAAKTFSKKIDNILYSKTHPPTNVNNSYSHWILDDQFARNMIKIRYEFGFDEPHPRHGRVSVEQSLTYALNVLDSVIIPLHSSFFLASTMNMQLQSQNSHKLSSWMYENGTIRSDFQSISWNVLKSNNSNDNEDTESLLRPCRYEDMLSLYNNMMFRLEERIKGSNEDNKISTSIRILRQCLETLKNEKNEETCQESNNGKSLIPAVLCHMDLQPQNMMLYQTEQKKGPDESCYNDVPRIASVLDWEEACYADPRFELILICRKVVANRTQADSIWQYYCTIMEQRFSCPQSPMKYNFGPIDPWLKLETFHSLLTLLMQSMDLVGGGRSPWEQKPDLKGKIEREFCRFVDLGYDFCSEAA